MKLNNRKYALSILIGLFLVLIATSSLFHNHKPSFEEPVNCPVFLFQTVLATAIISIFLIALAGVDHFEYLLLYKESHHHRNIHFRSISNRAPPEDLL
jgi:hypothetical protein